VPKEKLIIIPNGVDENIWRPFCGKNKKHYQVKNKLGNERIFLYMGRIANEKISKHFYGLGAKQKTIIVN